MQNQVKIVPHSKSIFCILNLIMALKFENWKVLNLYAHFSKNSKTRCNPEFYLMHSPNV